MTRELVIRILPEGPDSWRVDLMQRTGAAPDSVASGMLDLPAAEVTRLAHLLGDGTSDAEVFAEGRALYRRLDVALGAAFQKELDTAQPLAIHLDLPSGALHSIPWEIMVWPQETAADPLPVPIARKHPLSRVFKPDWQAVVPLPRGPLRVMLVIGARADPAVDAEGEEDEIRNQVQASQRTIDIETIAPASKDELYARLAIFQPHVLHFIGHADNGPPELVLADWRWTSVDIGSDVGGPALDDWKPRLVFLNACRTALGSEAAQASEAVEASQGIASCAMAFLLNASAVIAMQGDIRGAEAGRLAGAFYKHLAQGRPVNEALLRARSIIAGNNQFRQAAFAALTTRCAPGCALPQFRAMDDSYLKREPNCEFLPRLRAFVNQVQPRRDLCRSIWPFEDTQPAKRFVMLRGQAGYGKSLLGAWLLDLGLRHGHHVRYVRVGDQKSAVGCLQVLDLIWNASPGLGSPLTDPLPALSPALAERLKTSYDPAVFVQFRQELLALSAARPVTIVLDQIRQRVDDGGFWTLWEQLFVPLARDELPNVSLLLALSQQDYEYYQVDLKLRTRPELAIPTNVIELHALTPAEFSERFREYACFRDPRFRKADERNLLDVSIRLMHRNLPASITFDLLEAKAQEVARAASVELPLLR